MRHQVKKHKLSRPQDQRKALLRTLATQLFLHNEIKTTMAKAKALKAYADNIITLAKKDNVAARRLVSKYIYDNHTGFFISKDSGEVSAEDTKNLIEETVLRKIFLNVVPRYSERNGGYTRILRLPPRRGDASEMAIIQLV